MIDSGGGPSHIHAEDLSFLTQRGRGMNPWKEVKTCSTEWTPW